MEKMKLLCPVHSYKMTELQIKTGADEIYLGMTWKGLKNITLGARGATTWDGIPCQVSSEDELRRIVKLAHDNNVKVRFVANIFTADPCKKLFMDYVRAGVSAGIDAVIIGDPLAALWIRDEGIDIPLYGGVIMFNYNIEQVKWLRELGISGVIVPTDMLIEEIRELRKYEEMDYEAFVLFGCSYISGRCSMHGQSGESYDVAMMCRSLYKVKTPDGNIVENKLLDLNVLCGICSLPYLQEAGIKSVKLLGRCFEPLLAASFTKVFRYSLDEVFEGKPIEEVKENVVKMAPMWKEHFCPTKRCLYIPTHLRQFHV